LGGDQRNLFNQCVSNGRASRNRAAPAGVDRDWDSIFAAADVSCGRGRANLEV
jgi:hypothetical protein